MALHSFYLLFLLSIWLPHRSNCAFRLLGTLPVKPNAVPMKSIKDIQSKMQCAAVAMKNKATYYSLDENSTCSIYKKFDDLYDSSGGESGTDKTVYVQSSRSSNASSEANIALNKTSQQSKTDRGGEPMLAVDGNSTTDLEISPEYYCAQTGLLSDGSLPWLRVDLSKEYNIMKVILHTVGRHITLLHDIEVHVTNLDIQNGAMNISSLCGKRTGALPAGPNGILCSKTLTGRYVHIQVVKNCTDAGCPGKSLNFLTLCEVDILIDKYEAPDVIEPIPWYYLDNVSVFKSATASTVVLTDPADGFNNITIGIWGGRNCMHTGNEQWPWLRVNLEGIFIVAGVVIYNRCDNEATRIVAHDIDIRVGKKDIGAYPKDVPFKGNSLCVYTGTVPPKCPFQVFNCSNPLIGQYVSLQIVKSCTDPSGCSGAAHRLHLCEVQVMGVPYLTTNFLSTTEKQFEVLQSNKPTNLDASLAMDGQLSDGDPSMCSFSSSSDDKLPWWRVDLKKEYRIFKIIVHSLATNKSLVHDVRVFVGNDDIKDLPIDGTLSTDDLCGERKGILPAGYTTFRCNSTSGRYVTIQVTKKCNATSCPSEYKAVLGLCEVDLLIDKSDENSSNAVYPTVPWYYLDNVGLNKKNAKHSSECCSGSPTLALDGNINTIWGPLGHCQHTDYEKFPWWQANMDGMYVVHTVVVYNRCDAGYELMKHDLDIRIGYKNFLLYPRNVPLTMNALCKYTGQVPLACPRSEHNCTTPILGQYLSFQIVKNCNYTGGCQDVVNSHWLHLCEVQIMALPVTAVNFLSESGRKYDISQSSTRTPYTASLAMDGFVPNKLDSFYNNSQCTFSSVYENPAYPWWQVDLSQISKVHQIILTNRNAPLNALLHDIQATVGFKDVALAASNSTFTKNTMCTRKEGILPPGKNVLKCDKPLTGRFVTIQIYQLCSGPQCISTTENVLSLCEVQVLGLLI